VDENLAAVLVAAITGGFGFLGVLVVQWASREKARKLHRQDSVNSIMDKSEPVDIVNHIASLSHAIRENGIVAREGIQALKEDLMDVKESVRDIERRLGN